MKENQLELSADQKRLIEERQIARDAKDWKRSDELRDMLLKTGITIMDLPGGKYKVSPISATTTEK